MVNRLILNLVYEFNSQHAGGPGSVLRTRSVVEPPVFAAFSTLGNIGAPLRTYEESDPETYVMESTASTYAEKSRASSV